MLSRHIAFTMIMGVFVFLTSWTVAAGEDISAVHVDKIAGIYAGKTLLPREKAAVELMQLGMDRLYGIKVKSVTRIDRMGEDQALIVLGRDEVLSQGLITQAELSRVERGGYVIKCGNGRIMIAGEDAWCTYYGVLELLERLGMHFYTENAFSAVTTKPESRKIEPCTIADKPVFLIRNGWSADRRQFHITLGDPRKGLNPELFTHKAGSDLWIDHTAGYLVPKALYYDKHPEYYAMDGSGKRIAKDAFSDHRTALCLSNPDVTKISIERALAWIKLNPEKKFFHITHGDTGVWCQCPECLKHDPAPGQYSSRLLECWVNPVARAIAKKYPDKLLLTFAYAGSDAPPRTVRPEKNVGVIVATGCGFFPFWEHAMAENTRIRPIREKVEAWANIAPGQVSVCEYLGAYEPSILDKMTGRLRWYASKGLTGINATYGSPTNFRPIWGYVWPRMCWNPNRDGLAMAKDFIKYYYGPAAEPVAQLFDLIHEQYQSTLANGKKLTDEAYAPDFYSPEFVSAALACFDEATNAVSGDPKLKKEIKNEEYLFLGDLVAHFPSYTLSRESNAQLLKHLGRQRALAQEIGKELEFIRTTQIMATKLDKNGKKGYQKLIGDWLGTSTQMQPVKIRNGFQFRPEMFLWGDFGPDDFPQATCQSHPKFPSPSKFCAGVKPKATDSRGNTTNARMNVTFDLESVPGDGAASLELEGQDAIRYWAKPRDFDAVGHIEILANNEKVFAGVVGFVRGNWSRRAFKIPAGILKKGQNVIEIRNITPQRPGVSPHTVCWILVSDAKLTFTQAGN